MSNKIKYPELNCPIATECLMKVNLPIGSGTIISSTPEDLEAKLKLVHECVNDEIKFNQSNIRAVSSYQPRSPSVTEISGQVVPQRVAISTLCDGQFKQIRNKRISKDGFYIDRWGGPGDFISVQLDKLTCKEALQCMNKLELSFDGTEGPMQIKRYRDTKNRTVDELQNSIRNQCVNAPTPPGPSPPPPSPTPPVPSPPPPSPPPSTDDATGVDDFMGIGVSQNVVLIGVGGAMMAAAALAL